MATEGEVWHATMTKCDPVTAHSLLRIRRMRPELSAAQSSSRCRLYKRAPPPPLPPAARGEAAGAASIPIDAEEEDGDESSSSLETAQSALRRRRAILRGA